MGMLGIPHSHRHCTSRVILSVSKKVDFLEFQLQGKRIGVLINVEIPSGIREWIGSACRSGSQAANPVFGKGMEMDQPELGWGWERAGAAWSLSQSRVLAPRNSWKC